MVIRLAAGLLCCAALAAAQQPGEVTVTGRDLTPAVLAAAGQVQVPVQVTDAAGHGITGLKAGDFTLQAGGQNLAVALAPGGERTVVLLFDDANTFAPGMTWARTAALRALPETLPAGERWGLLTTSGLLQVAPTTDMSALRAALQKLQSRAQQFGPSAAAGTPGKTEAMHQGGNNDEMLQNQSAISLDRFGEAITYAAAQPGEVVMVVVSRGFATEFPANGANLDHQLSRLKEIAAGAPVTINAIDPAALNGFQGAAQWQLELGVLSMLTQATGGRMADEQSQLPNAFTQFTEPVPGAYRLSFAPPAKARGLQHLQVNVSNGALVKTRPDVAVSSDTSALDAKLRDALQGAKTDELALEVRPEKWRPTAGAATGARLLVVFAPKALSFTNQNGRHQQHLRVAAVLSDRAGNWVAAREGDVVLNLTDATLKKLTQTNIPVALELAAPAGTYHVIIVGQEALHGATTALAANLAIQ